MTCRPILHALSLLAMLTAPAVVVGGCGEPPPAAPPEHWVQQGHETSALSESAAEVAVTATYDVSGLVRSEEQLAEAAVLTGQFELSQAVWALESAFVASAMQLRDGLAKSSPYLQRELRRPGTSFMADDGARTLTLVGSPGAHRLLTRRLAGARAHADEVVRYLFDSSAPVRERRGR